MTSGPDWHQLAEGALADLPQILTDPSVRSMIERALREALLRGDDNSTLRRILMSLPELRAWVRRRTPGLDVDCTGRPGSRSAGRAHAQAPQPGLLGEEPLGEEPTDAGSAEPDTLPATRGAGEEAERARWINAELEDQAPTEPLRVGYTVTLAFD